MNGPFARLCVAVFSAVWLLLAPVASAQGLGTWFSPGLLIRDHADLEGMNGCTNCHAPGRGPTPDRCLKCHESVQKQITNRQGYHSRANRNVACEKCHPDHRGRDHQAIPDLSRDTTFNHKTDANWALEGEHGRIACKACHTSPGKYVGLDEACTACHKDPHGKDQSKRTLLKKCESCHDAEDWKALPLPVSVFDHTKTQDSDYLLEGEHVDVDCADCHFEMRFVPLEYKKCTACHVNSHRAAFRNQACEDCHANSQTWVVLGFDHNLTKYRLEGEHRKVTCNECHKGDKTAPMAFQKCETCHADMHKGQFSPRVCEDCHTVNDADFALRSYDHDQTDFALVGRHAEKPTCEDCHGDRDKGVYADLPFDDCDRCHEDAHDGTYEPTKCEICHITEGFEIQAFDHDKTAFPHTGKHIGLQCDLCHVSGQWNGVLHESCFDCHHTRAPHRPVITPDMCENCHTTKGFDQFIFNHAEETDFDLAPAHDELKCTLCHTQVYDFLGLDSSCQVCHVDDRPWGHYEGDCGDCHEAEHWFPAGLGANDHEVTGFALVGVHSLEPCESCHPVGRPRGEAEPTCASCHMRDDPHMNMLGTVCADCHTEMSWLRTSWRHTTTGWPLRGSHRLAACVDCHATGYIGAPRECFRCHEAEGRACVEPRCIAAHLSPQFQNCDTCHRVFAWTPAQYPH